MKLDWVYIAAYRAFETLNDEERDEWLELWVSSANPYLTLNNRAFAQCYQEEFEDYASEHGWQEDYSAVESYKLVSDFSHDRYPQWGYRFEDISLDEWEALCEIVAQEESTRIVSYVKPSGHPSWMASTLRPLKGKTLKSIEYVPDGSPDKAWLQVRLSTGSNQVRLGLYLFDLLGRKVVDFICSDEDPSFSLGVGEPRLLLVGERVAGVEVVRYAASIDGAPLEGKPEDGYDFERMPGQHMAVVVRTKESVYSFYRHGSEDGTIYLGRSVPTDDELGLEEFRAFWAEGGHDVEVRRDVFEIE